MTYPPKSTTRKPLDMVSPLSDRPVSFKSGKNVTARNCVEMMKISENNQVWSFKTLVVTTVFRIWYLCWIWHFADINRAYIPFLNRFDRFVIITTKYKQWVSIQVDTLLAMRFTLFGGFYVDKYVSITLADWLSKIVYRCLCRETKERERESMYERKRKMNRMWFHIVFIRWEACIS